MQGLEKYSWDGHFHKVISEKSEQNLIFLIVTAIMRKAYMTNPFVISHNSNPRFMALPRR